MYHVWILLKKCRKKDNNWKFNHFTGLNIKRNSGNINPALSSLMPPSNYKYRNKEKYSNSKYMIGIFFKKCKGNLRKKCYNTTCKYYVRNTPCNIKVIIWLFYNSCRCKLTCNTKRSVYWYRAYHNHSKNHESYNRKK